VFCSIATFGTVVVVLVCGGFAVVPEDFGTVVVTASAANVVVVTVGVSAGVAPEMVVFKLALPWKTARIFFDVALSKSGTMTDMSSISCPFPGMV
jgi:hypothetical protein